MDTKTCKVCNKSFKSNQSLKAHQKFLHGKQVRGYECSYCGRKFMNASNRLRHQTVVHLKQRRYHCSNCDKSFSFRWVLDGHRAEKHGISEKHKCICKKAFSFLSNLSAHKKVCPVLNKKGGDGLAVCKTCLFNNCIFADISIFTADI